MDNSTSSVINSAAAEALEAAFIQALKDSQIVNVSMVPPVLCV